MCLVFECFDSDVRQFLKTQPLNLSWMWHVLCGVLAALAHMHVNGLVHADVKPAEVLLRGDGVFQDGRRRLLGRATVLSPGGGAESAGGAASASGGANDGESLEVTYQLPPSFAVLSFCLAKLRANETNIKRTPCFQPFF